MMEERRADARDAAEAAGARRSSSLPPSTWREIQGRAATLGVTAELSADGAELRLRRRAAAPNRRSAEA